MTTSGACASRPSPTTRVYTPSRALYRFAPRVRDADARKRLREHGGRRTLCCSFSADAAVLLLAEIAALPRRVRTGRTPAGLGRRLARASPGIRAFRAPQRHLYLHRLGTVQSHQGTRGGPYPKPRLAPYRTRTSSPFTLTRLVRTI
ncbi:uncharacterized [Tachysurus ichikawai]